jgi:hypothetical protein
VTRIGKLVPQERDMRTNCSPIFDAIASRYTVEINNHTWAVITDFDDCLNMSSSTDDLYSTQCDVFDVLLREYDTYSTCKYYYRHRAPHTPMNEDRRHNTRFNESSQTFDDTPASAPVTASPTPPPALSRRTGTRRTTAAHSAPAHTRSGIYLRVSAAR